MLFASPGPGSVGVWSYYGTHQLLCDYHYMGTGHLRLSQNVAQVQIKGKCAKEPEYRIRPVITSPRTDYSVPLIAGLLCAFSLTNIDQVYKQKKTGTSHVRLTFRLLSMFSRFMSISFKLILCFLIFTFSQSFIFFCVNDHAPYVDRLIFKSAMDQIWTAIAHFISTMTKFRFLVMTKCLFSVFGSFF